MSFILKMDRKQVLTIDPKSISWMLTKEELLHICSVLGCWWIYDYDAADAGRLGLHAILKSKNHSDGFINLKETLTYDSVLEIMALQQYGKYKKLYTSKAIEKPVWVCGIPTAATKLGKRVAQLIGAKFLEIKKDRNGNMCIDPKIVAQIKPGDTILIVEDLCSFGTGVSEAILLILSVAPQATVLPVMMYIFNRGELKEVNPLTQADPSVIERLATPDVKERVGRYTVNSLAAHKIKTWERVEGKDFPEWCELCRRGSGQIQPKKSDAHWHNLVTSQLPLAA